jgi:hypothetical protein
MMMMMTDELEIILKNSQYLPLWEEDVEDNKDGKHPISPFTPSPPHTHTHRASTLTHCPPSPPDTARFAVMLETLNC